MNRLARGFTLTLLVLSLSGASLPAPSPDAAQGTAVRAVVGQGFAAILACAACVAGGVIIAAGGPGAILVAASTPGSAVAVAACVTACYEAFQ